MLIDVHAHFHTSRSPRADWRRVNESRIRAGEKIGITAHVASILGTWGATSPTYFPSPGDASDANAAMLALCREYDGLVFGYCVVNPNYGQHALDEIDRRVDQGMIGVKLAASRRANDPLLDPVVSLAAERGVPVLHHVWQRRRRDWPGQEASDASELAELAARHPNARLILAHLGGGGDWGHTLRVVEDVPNIFVDLSGSGVDPDMLHAAVNRVGCSRLLWGADITLDTGWAKLRYLNNVVSAAELRQIAYLNAASVFPPGVFGVSD